ncbi:hypothetical protein CK203_089700 [Vitis vinifera]|uniref:Integrase catalytic domain-containing protein n=1 Tax=Vitis vinifera TaxID=29760 RepID=A0A438E6A4_VITVI|nr:hypothetical protein CK203_089700 [Vitis vinifera]
MPSGLLVAFKRHHLRHRSGAIQASVSSVVFRLASGAIPVVVQAPFKASSRAVFIRRSNAIEGAASLVCLASLTPTRATPFQTSHPFQRRVGAIDSHHYGIVLTLILVIGEGAMASFGGVSLPAARRWLQSSSIYANVNNIPVLNGTNFKKWKKHVIIVFECMDLDYALRMDRPSDLTSVSTVEQRSYKGTIPKETQAKAFLDQIANRFAANEKIKTNTILSKLVSMRYKGKENIREYIMEMSNLVTRLKALKLELSEDILVHLEKRLKQEKIESAHLAFTSQGFGANKKKKRDNKGKQTAVSETSKQKVQKKQDKEITYFFCKKVGHMKKTCTKYAAWREKKGTLLNFVCSEINLGIVPTNTWWIDTGATTRISVTMQGCLRSRMSTDGERYIYVGNDNKTAVKAIGLFRLQLDSGCEQHSGLFAKYLMKCGIVPQYTMPRTPSQNGVAERQNHTLKDMALQDNEKKLDSRTVNYYFVRYSKRSRGFKFYDPPSKSLFETGNAKFIKDVELSGKEPLRKVVFEEEFVSIPTTGHGHIMFDDTIQNVQSITEIQDTLEIPPAQVMEPIQVHEEVTQQPQEPQVQVPLRRSTREMRSTISDDYIVYLQEHKFDMGL